MKFAPFGSSSVLTREDMAVELFKGTFGVEAVQGKNGMVGVDELLKHKKAIGK